MNRLNFHKELSVLKNERGAVMLSNAVVSSLMIVILVLFGETVTTCYQYIALQHTLNEGLREGSVRSSKYGMAGLNDESIQFAIRRQNTRIRYKKVASDLNVNNNTLKKSSFVSGGIINDGLAEEGIAFKSSGVIEAEKNHWIEFRITKQLTFSKVLSLISKNYAGKTFNFNLIGRAKIKTK